MIEKHEEGAITARDMAVRRVIQLGFVLALIAMLGSMALGLALLRT